jgi:prophage regulatory protein
MSRILRESEVRKRIGFSHSTIWRRRRAGTFPMPVDLGGGMMGWTEESIDEYIESLPRVNIMVRRNDLDK